MASPAPALEDIPHVTPIACPVCKDGQAHLVWRGRDPFKPDGKTEFWVFACKSCGHEVRQTVES